MPSRGLKRVCASCSTLFYDFDKTPIICPSCKTEFTGSVKIKTRRSRILPDTIKPSEIEEDAPETIADVEEAEGDISLEDLKSSEEVDDEDDDAIDIEDLDDDEDLDIDDEDEDDELEIEEEDEEEEK